MRSSSRSREVVSRVSSSSSTSRQRRSGATGVSALQCGSVERGQGEREGGVRALRVPARGRAPAAGRGVQLRGGGEQDDVALEGAEPEAGDERVEGGGAGATPGAAAATALGCRFAVRLRRWGRCLGPRSRSAGRGVGARVTRTRPAAPRAAPSAPHRRRVGGVAPSRGVRSVVLRPAPHGRRYG